MPTPDEMVPSGPESSGLMLVRRYLEGKGLPVNAGNIRRAVEANAREPGSLEANGPRLGPVVLDLRNAGIEDASPMPPRGGGGGRTSAPPLPTPPVPPEGAGSNDIPGSPASAMPPSNIPTPGPVPPQAGPRVLNIQSPQQQLLGGPGEVPLLGGPPETPLLSGPGVGAAVLGGVPLAALLERARANLSLAGPRAAPTLSGPAPAPQIDGPAPVAQVEGPRGPALAAPAERPPIALPNQSTGRPTIALPDAAVPRPALQTAGVDLQAPPASSITPPTPASAAIDKAVRDTPAPTRAKTPSAKRIKLPVK